MGDEPGGRKNFILTENRAMRSYLIRALKGTAISTNETSFYSKKNCPATSSMPERKDVTTGTSFRQTHTEATRSSAEANDIVGFITERGDTSH